MTEDTANFLRDWCEAIEVDKILTHRSYWTSLYSEKEMQVFIGTNRHFVEMIKIEDYE